MSAQDTRAGGSRLPRMARPTSTGRWSYATAVVLIAGALIARSSLHPRFDEHPYLLFFPAVLIAAWFGGLGPGVLATALSALAAMSVFLPPDGFAVAAGADLVSLALFVATGLGISWINNQLRTAAATSAARAERLDAIIDTTVDGIIVISSEGLIEAFNRGAERLFGYPESEVLGRDVSLLMPSPYQEEHDGYLQRYLTTGQAKIIGKGREVSGRRRDGSVFPLHLSVGEMVVHGQRKFTGILHDLSARVRMEEQLREQASLARLGEMAAVVAHEVKNPLAGIRGAVQVLGQRLSEGGAAHPVVTEIIDRIDSLDQMMMDMLLFARPPTPRCAPTDIAPLVTNTVNLLSQDPALKGIEVEVEGGAPPVLADAEMLRVVFQNLLLNGAHAMHGRGTIRVAVTAVDASCQIVFSDSGPGIPPDVRDKIFTPFFTTKSRGSGLGLPTVKRLVEAHQGEVSIECPPAGGTTVIVRLPLGVP